MAQDMLTAYKLGWKTSYYQNTYDFKGEEEDIQPAGISAVTDTDDGEDVELPTQQISTDIDGEDDETCDACTI
jgi:ribonucleoside-diphosphate reductase alpha chain